MDTTASARPRLGPLLLPLVRPGCAGCQVSAEPGHRMACFAASTKPLRGTDEAILKLAKATNVTCSVNKGA
jgi:hypothetical protein